MESPPLTDENSKSPSISNMARRKVEIILQRELETQEDWEDFLSKEGLLVIDVYQEWAGPCTSLVNNLRKLKNELADDLLLYAVAKCDRIESLMQYRGKCKPCFLFFAGGALVNVVRGAQYPLLRNTIMKEVQKERKVLNGQARRIKIVDKELPRKEEMEMMEVEEEEDEEEPPEFTICIIKPDAVREGKVDDILALMQLEGITVMANEKKVLSEDTAREFYSHLSNEPFYEDYIEFMASGPSHILILSKEISEKGIISEWKEKLGSALVEDARQISPESWRAKFGSSGYMNALHASDNEESAARELGFFFPNMYNALVRRTSLNLERTLAIIRPDAYALYSEEIIGKIKEAGFHIALKKEIFLGRKEIEEFYQHVSEEAFFEDLVEEMTSGPLLVLGLAREDAVSKWREILGPSDLREALETAPHCLRAQFLVSESEMNLIHGSSTKEEADKEIKFFFPDEETVAVIKPDAYGSKDLILKKIQEAGFKITAKKEMTLNEQIIEKMYDKDFEYFEEMKKYLTAGPSVIMALTREDAVFGLKQLLGPVDPLEAKEIDPELFRAQFGTDKMCNALHGSKTTTEAFELISAVFKTDKKPKEGEKSDDALSSETPEFYSSSDSPLSVSYAMAEEIRANADDQVSRPCNSVQSLPEESMTDILHAESSVEILGSKTPSKEDRDNMISGVDKKSSDTKAAKQISHDVPSENVGDVEDKITPEDTVEGTEGIEKKDLAETSEAAEATSISPEAAQATDKSPEAAPATSKSPEATEATSRSPEATSKSPEATSKSPEATEAASKSPEATSKSPEATEAASKSPEATEAASKSPEATEATSKSPEATSKSPEATSRSPEATSKSPETAEATSRSPEATSKSPEATNKSPETAEATSRSPEATSKSPEATNKSPETAEATSRSPEATSKSPEATSKSPEATNKSPETAEATNKSPEATSKSPEATSRSPEAAEETSKLPEATEETSKSTENVENSEPTEN